MKKRSYYSEKDNIKDILIDLEYMNRKKQIYCATSLEVEILYNYIEDLRSDYGNKAQVERDLLQLRIDKAIEELKLGQEGLEEWHFDGFDPCLNDIIKILEGE